MTLEVPIDRRRALGRIGRGLGSLAALGLFAACEPGSSEFTVGARTPAQQPLKDSDEAGLWRVMEKAERDIAQSPRRVRDPALESYLRDVVCRVAGPHCGDMRLYVLRFPYFNAAVAPNGMAVVFSGVLLRVENEAQLAWVLGHETVHFVERHSLAEYRKYKKDTATATAVAIAAAAVGAVPVAALPMALAEQGLLAFSREQEVAADRQGIELIAAAGYAPSEALRVWQNLIAEDRVDPHYAAPNPLQSTHPAEGERMVALAAAAKRLTSAGDRVAAERYRDTVRPLRETFLEDELQLRQPERLLLVLKRLQAAEPGAPELHHYEAEARRLRGRAGDHDRARDAYRAALAADPGYARAWRGLGLVERDAGNVGAAREAFKNYLELNPEAPDAAFLQAYLTAGA